MEFAARLPPDLKLRGTTTKYLLKRVAADLLPAEVVARPKMGFGVPLERWFRHELRDLAHDVLLGPRAAGRGCFSPRFVRTLLDDHTSGRRPWHYQIWNLLVFELWHRMFIDERPKTAPAAILTPDASRFA
jgi:asparagine synthase (glutamine-hydrolysing)